MDRDGQFFKSSAVKATSKAPARLSRAAFMLCFLLDIGRLIHNARSDGRRGERTAIRASLRHDDYRFRAWLGLAINDARSASRASSTKLSNLL